MNYGAAEANSKEAMGLAFFILGLVVLVAGWAYGAGFFQVVLDLLGLVGIIGGFAVLRAAKADG